jgi:hypothetical protein
VLFAGQLFQQFGSKARFSDTGFAREQDQLAVTGFAGRRPDPH